MLEKKAPKPLSPEMKLFLARIDQIKQDHHIESDKEFDERIGTVNWLNRVRNGYIEKITNERYNAISETFKVDRQWLEHGSQKIKEHIPEGYQPQLKISEETEDEIGARVLNYLEKRKIKLSHRQVMYLFRLCREYYLDNFKLCDDKVIDAYVTIAKKKSNMEAA